MNRLKNISLRVKYSILVITLAILTVAGLYFSAEFLVLSQFQKLEEDRAYQNIDRVIGALNERISALNDFTSDWSAWDDTYEFVINNNQKYIQSNLDPFSYTSTKINLMIFVNNENKIVHSMSYDFIKQQITTVPDELVKHIKNGDPLLTHNGDLNHKISGIIMSNPPIIVSAQPIIKSDMTGPIKGTMVVGRLLDKLQIDSLEKTTSLTFDLLPYDQSAKNIMATSAKTYNGDMIAFVKDGNKTLNVYTPLKDIYGQPVLMIKLALPRDIYNQGQRMVGLLVVVGSVLWIVILAGGILFVNVNTLQPMTQIISDIKKITSTKNFSLKVKVSGEDEIGRLAQDVNSMLDVIRVLEKTRIDDSKQLGAQMDQIKSSNLELQETKKAMLNLLDDERKLESDLKNERDTAQAVISSMGEGLIVLNKDGVVRYMNKMAEQLIDMTSGAASGKMIYDIVKIHQGDIELPVNERPSYRTLQSGTKISTTLLDNYYLKTLTGKLVPIIVSTTPLMGEGITGATIVFRDSTAEKQNHDTIELLVKKRTSELSEKNVALEIAKKEISDGWLQQQQEKARLAASINGLSLGFIMTDKDGNILTVNKAASELLKINASLHNFSQVEEHFKDNVNLHDLFNQCLNERKPINAPNISHDNKYYRFFIAPILMKEEDNRIIGTVILFEDVTEAHILEKSKDEFFSIASHELRTPLTAVRGNTELIRQYYFDKIQDQDFREMIDDIHTSSVRLITLVNDFLDTSRLEQGRMKFNNTAFDLPGLIGETVKSLEAMASEKHLELVILRGKQQVSLAMGDRDKIKEVLLNLIGNAIKFTDTGKVTVTVFKEDVLPEAVKDQIAVTVTDNGRGMSPQNQIYLFHKFQQASSSIITRDTTKGTGLGLYISKLLIEGMKGTIFLYKSEEGKGSTFAFSLPRANS
jgi:signal transduction histidine kinase